MKITLAVPMSALCSQMHLYTSCSDDQGGCDVRDILPAIGQCRPGFCIFKLPVLEIEFQVISKTHIVQIMHIENKKLSAYCRYTLVQSTDGEMLPHPHL
jgi:hypothetical protein